MHSLAGIRVLLPLRQDAGVPLRDEQPLSLLLEKRLIQAARQRRYRQGVRGPSSAEFQEQKVYPSHPRAAEGEHGLGRGTHAQGARAARARRATTPRGCSICVPMIPPEHASTPRACVGVGITTAPSSSASTTCSSRLTRPRRGTRVSGLRGRLNEALRGGLIGLGMAETCDR
jgi:hypothetical protein